MDKLVDKSFYKSKAWRKTRDAYMQSQHYICELCGNAASICHHKEWLTAANVDDPNVTLNWELLQAVCQTCHNRIHFKTNSTATGLIFNSKGELVKE